MIMGGDITGKQIALIVRQNAGWRMGEGRDMETFDSSEAVDAACKRLSASGLYPVVIDQDEEQVLIADREAVEKRFKQERLDRVDSWMRLAEERLRPLGVQCFVSPGNDDDEDVGEIISAASWVQNPEGSVVDVGGHEMISWGWSNPTPWDTPREQSEADLGVKLDAMASQVRDSEGAIFNLHCPPYQSGLDTAPELDSSLKPVVRGGNVGIKPVGSTAVRDAIERFQPLLGLHGHVHESPAMKRIGRSMCINPGSDYRTANLRGAIVQVAPNKVTAWTLTTG
jgi:Icc-related predicted phosphoesterase